jgi:hypothetical protein
MISPGCTCLRQLPALSDPAVQRRLRLLEQDHVFAACRLGRFGTQLACRRIEGSGDGDDDFLLHEGRLGVGVVPGGAQMR